MMQRDITADDLTLRREEAHRDSFYFCLLRNHFLFPSAEFEVTKVIHTVHYSLDYLTSRIPLGPKTRRPKK